MKQVIPNPTPKFPSAICSQKPTGKQRKALKAYLDKVFGVGTLLHKDYTPDKEHIYQDTGIMMISYATVLTQANS